MLILRKMSVMILFSILLFSAGASVFSYEAEISHIESAGVNLEPIGFSKDGLFSYAYRYWFSGCQQYVVQDLIQDKVLMGNDEDCPEGSDEEIVNGIKSKFGVSAREQKPILFPLKTEDDVIDISIECSSDTRTDGPQMYDVKMTSQRFGSKTIGTFTPIYKVYLPALYLKSPYENRVAVLINYTEPGPGDTYSEGTLVFGGHLRSALK